MESCPLFYAAVPARNSFKKQTAAAEARQSLLAARLYCLPRVTVALQGNTDKDQYANAGNVTRSLLPSSALSIQSEDLLSELLLAQRESAPRRPSSVREGQLAWVHPSVAAAWRCEEQAGRRGRGRVRGCKTGYEL